MPGKIASLEMSYKIYAKAFFVDEICYETI